MFRSLKHIAVATVITASPYAKEAYLLSKKHAKEHRDLAAKHFGEGKAVVTRLENGIALNEVAN